MRYLVVAVVAAAVAVFALQNTTPVDLRFIVWKMPQVPLATVVLLSVASGIVVVGVPLWYRLWRLRGQVRDVERAVADRQPPARTPPA